MEVNTGASLSLICEKTCLSMCIFVYRLTLHGERISVLGSIQVEVSYNNQTKQLPLLVVKGQGPNLLGRDWMNVLTFDWQAIHKVQDNRQLDELLPKYSALFVGKLEGVKVKLHVDIGAHLKPDQCHWPYGKK